jgi:uncharacterized protein
LEGHSEGGLVAEREHQSGARYINCVNTFALKGRKYPHFSLEDFVIPDDDHLSVYPSMISRALLRVLPGTGPYAGG